MVVIKFSCYQCTFCSSVLSITFIVTLLIGCLVAVYTLILQLLHSKLSLDVQTPINATVPIDIKVFAWLHSVLSAFFIFWNHSSIAWFTTVFLSVLLPNIKWFHRLFSITFCTCQMLQYSYLKPGFSVHSFYFWIPTFLQKHIYIWSFFLFSFCCGCYLVFPTGNILISAQSVVAVNNIEFLNWCTPREWSACWFSSRF